MKNWDWTLICSILSAIAALGLLICTIIGFWFVKKQINIAKNKDILDFFHKEISQFMNENKNKHAEFHQIIISTFYNILICNPQNNERYLDNKYDEVLNQIIGKYKNEIQNNTIFSFNYYEWWLSDKKINKDFEDIVLRDDFKNVVFFYNNYESVIEKNFKSKLLNSMDINEKKELYYKIKSEMEINFNMFIVNFSSLSFHINEILKKLSQKVL